MESPSKRRYASISHPQGENQSIKKVIPQGNYQSNIEGARGDVKTPGMGNAMKPPHRIPKIDIRQASGHDPLSPSYNVSQTSPNRFDSRLEKHGTEHISQTPMNGGKPKVKKS